MSQATTLVFFRVMAQSVNLFLAYCRQVVTIIALYRLQSALTVTDVIPWYSGPVCVYTTKE